MGRRIPTKSSLLSELARPRVEWPDIMSTLEFWFALLIFVVLTVGLGALRLAF
jgi:hypothetical protein